MAGGYWEAAGARKVFRHPVPLQAIAARLAPAARILDFGCGYGRAMRDLARAGFRNTVGTDPSAALIARGRRESPGCAWSTRRTCRWSTPRPRSTPSC